MSEPRSAGSRLAIVMGVIVVGLVVTAAVVNSLRPVTDYPRDTAEGTVQAFLFAINDDDFDAAHDLLAPELAADCQPGELLRPDFEASRIVVGDVTDAGDEVFVEVLITVVEAGSDFEPYRYEDQWHFTLIQGQDGPLISELPYYYWCEED